MNNFKNTVAAGLFYPSDPVKLQNELNLLFSVSQTKSEFNGITGIIAPHAGYIYSGKTAAYAFNLLKGKNFTNVIILSPSHREYFAGSCIYEGDGFITPLGSIPINKEMRDKIIDNSKTIFKGKKGHKEEHAVEVQLPFLQMVLNDFYIIPIVMGDQGKVFVEELASAIAAAADENTLIVASSDLSHYYTKEEADQLDSIVEKRIMNFQYEQLMDDFNRRNCEACGGGPIITMMKAASLLNKNKSFVLHRSDSGDTTGDYREVVGYLSAVIYGE